MTDKYEIEVLLRPPVELASSIVAISAAVFIYKAPSALMMTPSVALVSGSCLLGVGCWRGYQGWKILRYQRHLKYSLRYELSSKNIPISQKVLFLGRGFRWNQTHTERLYAARDKRAEKYLQLNKLTQWIRRKEIDWENTPILKKIVQWTSTDSVLNPVRPPPPVGGDPVIHGVGFETETNVTMPLSDRVGHMVVVARTRHGKTRLAELLITQDIRRGNNCVIAFDPKGDADLLKRMYVETKRAGRRLIIFHLGYPELSARYNAVGNYSRITEVASRIASQLSSEGDAAAFREFVWLFINIIAVALAALNEVPDFKKLRRYLLNIDPLLISYGMFWLDANGVEGWEEDLKKIKDAVHVKSLPKAEQGKDPVAIALVRYFKTLEVDQALEGLISIFQYDRDFYQKITIAVKPLLEKLTTGNTASILTPDLNDENDSRPILSWPQSIRDNDVVYVGLDALTEPESAKTVSAAMFSDLTSYAGHIAKFGVYPEGEHPPGTKLTKPTVVIHGDEFSDLIGPQFKTMINKSGGSGYELNLYTQTWSDPIAELGSEAKAGQIAGNIGTMIIMGVKEISTCEMFTKQLPEVSVSEIMAVSGVTDNAETDGSFGFVSNNQDRISISRVPMISPADVIALSKGQAFVILRGSELWKIRIPMPTKIDDEELPSDLGTMLKAMRKNYTSIEDWQSYHGE